MVSISPPKREREKERDRVESMRRDARARRALPLVRSRRCRREKREDSTLEPSKSLGKSNPPRERERERESPRNVRPRPRTLTVLYVNRSSFRSFKMLPKPMLATSKTPSLRSHAHESNWCPSKGAQKVKERGGVLRKRNDGVQFLHF